jgi:4-alpha-glucanotransferase
MTDPTTKEASSPLERLAQASGILTEYVDISGKPQPASPDALRALLGALGTPAATDADVAAALGHTRETEGGLGFEAVTTAWLPDPVELHLRVPKALANTTARSLRLELTHLPTGLCRKRASHTLEFDIRLGPGEESGSFGRSRPVSESSASSVTHYVIELREPVGIGRYRVECELDETRAVAYLLRAPRRVHSVEEKSWGVFAPTYALAHSEESLAARGEHHFGAGTLRELRALCDWTKRQGGHFVGTLPLLSAFYRELFNTSPYSPVTRLFWNELYLDVDAILVEQPCAAVREKLGSEGIQRLLRAPEGRCIDFQPLAEARRGLLELLAQDFFDHHMAESDAYQRYVAENCEVEQYARFRSAVEKQEGPWQSFMSPVGRSVGVSLTRTAPDAGKAWRQQYHLYVQWQMHRQMQGFSRSEDTAGLYLDLPMGCHESGFDTWRYPKSFLLGAYTGAPPDMFFTKGQNWGFFPPHPQGCREDGYEYFAACLGHHMSAASLLRLDHVMGLHRLYCIPPGLDATEGAYLGYDAEEHYALLCIASHEHDCRVIGENLGTVPEAARRLMAEHDLTGMTVGQFSFQPQSPAYPAPEGNVVASLNTHDVPPFGAYVTSADIDDRVDLGLLSEAEAEDERTARTLILEALAKDFELDAPDPQELLEGVLRVLAQSPARAVLVTLEDLWLEKLPQNVPGTVFERPNWQRRLTHRLEELDRFAPLLETLRRARER